jgi:hypothetical protein
MVLVITTADVSVPENDQTMFIRLTTNKDAIKDVTFSIIGGDDRDKFAFISGNELHFEHADFEAREDHTYSVEVAARIEKGRPDHRQLWHPRSGYWSELHRLGR